MLPDGSFACISGNPRQITRMSVPQTTIGIAYDYDQTLSPTYMQDEVLFPAFGINSAAFWKKCQQLVREDGWRILLVIGVSTLLVMVVTAFTVEAVCRWRSRHEV